jgi:hypothetical protein
MKFIKDGCTTYYNIDKIKRVRVWQSGDVGELLFDDNTTERVPRGVAIIAGESLSRVISPALKNEDIIVPEGSGVQFEEIAIKKSIKRKKK